MPTTRARTSSSRVISYVVLNRFSAGISAAEDKVAMQEGTSPMARNVEWREQGGFFVRKGVGALIYGAAGEQMQPPGAIPLRFYHYVRDPTSATGFTSQYLVALDDGRVVVGVDFGAPLTTAGAWLVIQVGGTNLVTSGPPIAVAWDTNLYITLGNIETQGVGHNMVRWNGTTAAALGTTYVNDYAAPVGGNMPTARHMANWSERMWVGCCVPQTGPVEGSRIRWSHPGRPEDWAEDDYIDVGQQGDVITGLAPMRDMLVVFKRSSTYALLGSGASNFRVVEISATVGCTGQWTRDQQGSVVFWDGTLGACHFDGSKVENLFEPLQRFMSGGAGSSITSCGGMVTDGERIYAVTDFQDYYGARVPEPTVTKGKPRTGTPLEPGRTTWADLTSNGIAWSATSGYRWLRVSVEFYNIAWVYRPGAGWTSFTLSHPAASAITMVGQVRSRMAPTGDVVSNRRIVYGLSLGTVPLYLSDRYDNGRDWWTEDDQRGIDSFYMTSWLHGGLPAQIKKWKAPRIVQEGDEPGVLLIDVYHDFNHDSLRRTLLSQVPEPGLGFDSYWVDKPGTIGRAKAVMLIIRPQDARHWGVSSITIPVHPKVMR